MKYKMLNPYEPTRFPTDHGDVQDSQSNRQNKLTLVEKAATVIVGTIILFMVAIPIIYFLGIVLLFVQDWR
jgi:hypothetical protein